MSVDLEPLLPLWLIGALAAGVVLSAAIRFRTAPIGALLRVVFGALVVLFLLSPEQIRQTYETLPDQALILSDDSGSIGLGKRTMIRDAAEERLRSTLEDQGVEVVSRPFGTADASNIADGLAAGLSAVNRGQLAGVFVLTDGQLEGAEEIASAELPAPLHGVLVGDTEEERDRRIAWNRRPSFGLVGEETALEFRVEDDRAGAPIPVTLRVDGELILERAVMPGTDARFELPLERPGERVIELSVPTMRGELTARNNAISAKVNVIRDRLRVLLISGEPHAGERVWRNVLKSDPAVDLVHYTILKPADKIAPAAEGELNLIAFPSRELFLEKLKHFNVVIFDRYTYRGVISSFELAEVARFVEDGGAVLIAAGPELAQDGSLADQPNLSYILPALPTGVARERAFVPERTDLGNRHPITSELTASDEWGRWLRSIPVNPRRGDVLLSAGDGAPLLITDRVGEGRIAMMLSDHLWLWARGFDGGGPHREFLRRLVHWLMAEPELEEEALRATLSADGTLNVTRRSLDDEVGLVEAETENGPLDAIELSEQSGGNFAASIEGIDADRVRLATTTADGRTLTAAAIRERGAAREFAAVTVTPSKLEGAARPLGGGIINVASVAEARQLDVRQVRAGRDRKHGETWLGITPRNARAVLSERREPLLPRAPLALLAGAVLFAAWLLESGRLASLWSNRRTSGGEIQQGA